MNLDDQRKQDLAKALEQYQTLAKQLAAVEIDINHLQELLSSGGRWRRDESDL